MSTARSALAVSLAVSVVALLGCATGPDPASPTPISPAVEQHPITHPATDADIAATHSKEPIAADSAVLYVNGLGCPLCATNVDKQLRRVRGVTSADVDLSTGIVTVAFGTGIHPEPATLAAAVEDAGFTLVKIEARP